MCNYSLEVLKSRDAIAGERLETRRFYTGSLGFASAKEPDVAVCIKNGVTLLLRDVPRELRSELKIGAEAIATFATVHRRRRWWDIWTLTGDDHDALLFSGGTTILISSLPEGLTADVLSPGREGIPADKAEYPVLTPLDS